MYALVFVYVGMRVLIHFAFLSIHLDGSHELTNSLHNKAAGQIT